MRFDFPFFVCFALLLRGAFRYAWSDKAKVCVCVGEMNESGQVTLQGLR